MQKKLIARHYLILLIVALSLTSLDLVAQNQKTINGSVKDITSGNPLSDVSVAVKGTNRGTITNPDGEFTINGSIGEIIVFSRVGYQTAEETISSQNVIDIFLRAGTSELDEVVVIGYGTQRKSDLTGAVGSVSSATLQTRPSASVAQELAGRIPGVNVSVNSGRPGGNATIRIRGNSSISITNDPLYIVDGVISSINFLNPNDIASIEVLKDASSTAIYGARGSNGVVLVTTKRGSKKGGIVNYSSEISVGQLTREIPVLNSREFLHTEDVSYQNSQKYDSAGWAAGKYKDPKLKRTNPLLFDAKGDPLYNTNWQKLLTQSAFTQNHNLSFSGGDAKNNYGVYLGYRDEEGLVRTSTLKRYSARFVFDSEIKPWLKVGGNLSYNNQMENLTDFVGSSGVEALREGVEQLPIIPVKFPDGSWASNASYPDVEAAPNPLQILRDRTNKVQNDFILGSIFANISLAKGLEFRSSIGVNINQQRTNLYAGKNLNFISATQKGTAAVSNSKNNFWQIDNYLTYNTTISSEHTFTGLLGAESQHTDYYTFSATAWDFQDDFFRTNNLGVAANPRPPGSSTNTYNLNSYFSRINYGFKGRYLLTLSGRFDGSSKFGSKNRYGFFPSAAVAWRVTDEDFMKNIPVISNLKIRGSAGYTGNSEIASFQSQAGLGNYSYVFNNSLAPGVGIGRLPNSGLQWEKTGQTDIGIELGLLNNRISMEIDFYSKLTSNMLLNSPVPSTSGVTTVTQNIGSMRNRGIEISLNTINVATNNFSWNTNFNIGLNKNKVVSLSNNDADIFPGPRYVSETNIARVGEPIGSFYGYVRLGTWGSDEIIKAASYDKLPGDLKFQDTNNDGKINALDMDIIGKGIPDGYGSFINTWRYKNFDLVFDLQFVYGNDVYVLSKFVQEFRTGLANSRKTVLDAWTPENQNTMVAQLRPASAGYDALQDTKMVEDGSFIRGRNLLLGYNFSSELTKKLQLSSLRVTASVQNLFLITKYTGYDPETSTRAETYGQGIINFDYPKPRVFMFGLYVGL